MALLLDSFYPLLTSFSHGMLHDSSAKLAGWAKALTAKRKKPLIIWLSSELYVFDLQQLDLGEIHNWNQLASIKWHEIFDSGFGRAASVPRESSCLDARKKCRLLIEMGGFVRGIFGIRQVVGIPDDRSSGIWQLKKPVA